MYRTAAALALASAALACGSGSSAGAAGRKGEVGVTFSVLVARSGEGTVTSSDGKIRCGTGGSACSATFAWSDVVVLTATPDAGFAFGTWAGDCMGETCVLSTRESGADKYVVPVFGPPGETPHENFTLPSRHAPAYFQFLAGAAGARRCTACHGETLAGVGIVPGCTECHARAGWTSWQSNCSFCHGVKDAVTQAGYDPAVHPEYAAPPADVTMRLTGAASAATGAHEAHLAGRSLGRAIACRECHTVPSSLAHVSGVAEVSFGTLASAGGARPAWDLATLTCSATYCHGATLAAGGRVPAPTWNAGPSAAACDACHGAPPPSHDPSQRECGGCHDGYSSTTVDAATHLNGKIEGIRPTCTSCHGDPTRTGADPAIASMPPMGTHGETATTEPAVGAHVAHLTDGPVARALQCIDCHDVPLSTEHANGVVDFAWSPLAKGAATPTYDRATGACASTYCHGSFPDGAAANAPVWTAGTAGARCGSCHGLPPPAPHPQLTACERCHLGYTSTTVNVADHVNGVPDYFLTCTSCHGSGSSAAPPTDTTGRTEVTLVSVGAHQAHVAPGLTATAIPCSACHGSAAASYGNSHSDGSVQVAFTGLTNQGTATSYTRISSTSATCASSYCHGGSSALKGGTSTTPVWTKVDGTYKACTACHGDPPPAPHVQRGDCGTCHPGYGDRSTSGARTVNLATHVNGSVDVVSLTCTTCHGALGVNAAPPVATNGDSGTSDIRVGAHQAHVAAKLMPAMPCTECHGAAAASDTTSHANGTIEMSFGSAANRGGAASVWSEASATCASTYCHGSTSAVAGGTGTTPVWTKVDGTYSACTSCHGAPPTANGHVNRTDCGTCHAGYTSMTVNVATHLNGVVDVAGTVGCTTCHGSANPAPPVATNGDSTPDRPFVGAHQAHVAATLTSTAIACSACHGAGAASYTVRHEDGTVQMAFTGITGASTAWTGASCVSSYCHGGSSALKGGTATTPAWTKVDGTYKACTACHGDPPPAPHVQDASCGKCHDGYTDASVNAALHVNGSVDVASLTCTTCHGVAGVNAAPPVATNGESGTSDVRVGAHQAHVAAKLMPAMPCTECHGAAAASYTTSHADGVIDASFGSTANRGGAATVWSEASATCASTYCHGGTSAVAGGTGTTPVWTKVDGTYSACTSCHGAPPTANGHVNRTDCGTCHAGYTSTTVNVATHLNGTVDVAGTVGCTTCHGSANAAPPAATNGDSTPDKPFVGAHQAHVAATLTATAITCSACHGAGAASYTVRHEDGTVQVSFTGITGASTAWTGAGCVSSYCHGGSSALKGGTATAPAWTVVNGTYKACTACHGDPPPAPHVQDAACGRCHDGYTDASVNAVLHVNGTVDVVSLTCTTCHGTFGVNAAPPVATNGDSTADKLLVGAHQAHVTTLLMRRATLENCAECHGDVSGYTTSHANGSVELSFGALANVGTAASFTAADGKCSNTYCHGGTSALQGGTGTAPVWTVTGTYGKCWSCHGAPPPAPHVQRTDCGTCHGAGYSLLGVDPSTHIDGVVDVVTLSCTTCHGTSGQNAAPPVATNGDATTDKISVGAHQAHVNTALMPVTTLANCTECHGAAAATFGTSHANGTLTVAFGATADSGTATTWTEGTATCASNYCHGGSSAAGLNGESKVLQGGTGTTPVWTRVDGTFKACTSCHGSPPPLDASRGQYHPQNTACDQCHGAGYSRTGVVAATHIDRTVQLPGRTKSCNVCHGSVDGTTFVAGADANAIAAPGTSASGRTVAAGAHLAHVSQASNPYMAPVHCTECHGVDKQAASDHADGSGFPVWTSATVATRGGMTPAAYDGSTGTCASTYCHGKYSTSTYGNAGTGTLTPAPAWGAAGKLGCESCHGDPPLFQATDTTQAHPTSTTCSACHDGYSDKGASPRTVNLAAHLNGTVDVAKPGNKDCTTCHGAILAAMQNASSNHHHYMNNASVTALASGSKYPALSAALGGTTDTNRRCLVCHVDHDSFDPTVNTGGSSGRAWNLRADATDATVTPATGAGASNTDFSASATNGGLCVSCHQTSQPKSYVVTGDASATPAIPKARYQGSAHDYLPTPNAQFADGTKFYADCSKCHAGNTAATAPQFQGTTPGANTYALHDSDVASSSAVLGMASYTSPLEEDFCYRCHSRITDTAIGGTTKPTANRDWFGGQPMSSMAENIYAMFTDAARTNASYRHPTAGARARHKPFGDDVSSANRHVECADCHNPHAANKRGASTSGSVTAYGTVTGAPDTLTDGAQSWRTNDWIGYTVRITSGTQQGTQSVVYGNTTTALQVKFGTAVPVGSTYVLIENGRRVAAGSEPNAAPALGGIDGLVPSFSAKTPPTWDDSAGCGASGTANVCEAIWTAYQLPTYTPTAGAAHEGQVCLKCHSSYAYGTAQTNAPSSPSGQPNTAAGTGQAWNNAAGTTAMRQSDLGGDFNPLNAGHHAVFARGNNQPMVSSATATKSVLNGNWPKFNASTVSVTAGQTTVTLSSGAWPTGILPGWMIFIGSTSPAASTSGWYEVAAVNGSTTLTLDRPCAANAVGGNVATATTCGASQAYTLTPGLGAAFVPPYGPWSRLACSDCHASFASADPLGPHGSSQKWMLKSAVTQTFLGYTSGASANPSASLVTLTPADPNIICLNCHRRDVYGDYGSVPTPTTQVAGAVYKFSRQSHPADYKDGHSASYRTRWGIMCMNCHGGARQGGIHGENYGQGGTSSTGGSYSGKRLLGGSSWYAVTRGSPTSAGQCWTKKSTDAVDGCGQGHNGLYFGGVNTAGQGDPANYDYESTQTAGIK